MSYHDAMREINKKAHDLVCAFLLEMLANKFN